MKARTKLIRQEKHLQTKKSHISLFLEEQYDQVLDLTMNAHVLLNLLNELGKRDEMRGLLSILSLFRNEFNKFNNTSAQMLDSIYQTLKSNFCRKCYHFVKMYATLLWTS